MPWGEVALRTVWPHFKLNSAAAAVIVGVFGTTISPYLFFWQASEEVEDMHAERSRTARARSATGAGRNSAASAGTPGAACSYSDSHGLLHHSGDRGHAARRGITDIDTAAQAASALRPLAGNFAFLLFALGILGVGLIGVPVLAGSGAYALCRGHGLEMGLWSARRRDARGFYGVIAVSVLAGLVIQYSPISPMKALFWSAVINGVVAVPLMAVIILLVSKKSVMGAFTASRPLVILGWIATAVMGAAAVRMFIRD